MLLHFAFAMRHVTFTIFDSSARIRKMVLNDFQRDLEGANPNFTYYPCKMVYMVSILCIHRSFAPLGWCWNQEV